METLLIDDHGSAVPPPVWALLEGVLSMTGPLPVLVEWDNHIPPLAELLREAATAELLIENSRNAQGRKSAVVPTRQVTDVA